MGHIPPISSPICIPASCEQEALETEVLPRYIRQLLRIPALLPAFKSGQSTFNEVRHWSDLSLDFVIAGVDCCGTTSLRRNLPQHPEIGMTEWGLEWFFGGIIQRRTLPLKSHVDGFNGKWGPTRPRPRILGLYTAGLFHIIKDLLSVSLIPGIRLVVTLCDPLGRLEKHFWVDHYCGSAPDSGPCHSSIAKALRMPDFMKKQLVGADLLKLQSRFGKQLLFVHQESLRFAPVETYKRIATFLGASLPFPAGMSFGRYNSQRGHRTDLCRNASLVRAFHRYLSRYYAALERVLEVAGEPVPYALRLRLTRCDRAEELVDVRCDPERSC